MCLECNADYNFRTKQEVISYLNRMRSTVVQIFHQACACVLRLGKGFALPLTNPLLSQGTLSNTEKVLDNFLCQECRNVGRRRDPTGYALLSWTFCQHNGLLQIGVCERHSICSHPYLFLRKYFRMDLILK